ncbi:MAG: hypothetical protein Q9178_007841 [Gyalolechia marmorata]
MAYPGSAVSPAPLHYQLAMQTCRPTDLWPNFKSSTPNPEDIPKPKDAQQHASETALDRAFIAAHKALQGDSITPRQLGCTSTQSQLGDQTNHESVTFSETTTDVPSKRKAEAAGFKDEIEDAKKCKIEFVDFHTQMQKKKPGRPSKGIQRPKKPIKGFRTNRPVPAELTRGDIWCHVLENSPLSQLFRMRNVFRHYLLTWPSIWRIARRNTYGPDHPDPPPGISERQYADLLVGIGCQAKGCNDTRTRKVYWAFQRRWCVTCMKKNVAMNTGCNLFFRNYPDIPKCIPKAAFDQYGYYTCILGYGDNGQYTCMLSYGMDVRPPWLKPAYNDRIGYLRADLAKMSQEFAEFEAQIPGDEAETSAALQAWVDGKKKANDELVQHLQSIEDWMETYKMNLRKELETRREEKQAMTASLVPPSPPPDPPETPEIMDGYQATLESGITAATRIEGIYGEEWELTPMQYQAREEGSEVLSGNDREPIRPESLASRAQEYTALADARANAPTSETLAVIALARKVVDDMRDSNTRNPVADGEFVRIALMRTYKKFQEEWAARSNYRLLMDDARQVYQEVIEPRLNVRVKRSSFRRIEATGSVICPACKKAKGPRRLYNFPNLMAHIFDKHTADDSGDFKDFYVDRAQLPCHIGFPWCSIEWPRNLPILAVGQDTKGSWDLREEGEEHPLLSHCDPGAFDGRVAAVSIGPLACQFVPNVLFAASELAKCSLREEFKTQIALEYGVRKYESSEGSRPDFGLLEELQLALMRNGVTGLFEGFRCKKCCEAMVHYGRVAYLARSAKPLGELSEHFRKAHVKEDWTRDMLGLPTAQDLLAELQLPANSLGYNVFESLFPNQGDSTLDPQLRQLAVVVR